MKRIVLCLAVVLCAATLWADKALPTGKFSVSADKQVQFAPGNLQFHMKDSLWRFARNQFDWVGNANLEMGNRNFDGWVDLLSWSLGEANNYGATSNYDTLTYCNQTFVDWGTMFDDEPWYTMSREEWNYLLNTRAGANDKYGIAMIGDTLGMILLPDEWTEPEGVTFVPRTVPTSDLWRDEDAIDDTWDHYRVDKANMPANLFTLDQWAKLEAAGAVFLPFAGRRSGGYGNYLNTKCKIETSMFRYSYYENYLGTYWTSTLHNAAKGQADYVYTFSYYGGTDYRWGKTVIWSENGRYGQSVRLVRPYNDTPSALEQTNDKSQITNHKYIKGGHLLIEHNGQTFTILGAKVE